MWLWRAEDINNTFDISVYSFLIWIKPLIIVYQVKLVKDNDLKCVQVFS